MNLSEPVSTISGIGAETSKKLQKLSIFTVYDLLYHFPSRYIDYSVISKVSTLQEGEIVTVKGKIIKITTNYLRGRRLTIQKAILEDDTGTLQIVWFNQPFLIKTILNQQVSLSGKVSKNGSKYTLESPEYEIVRNDATIHTGRLVPVYPETARLTSKFLRAKINYVLKKIPGVVDPIPKDILLENKLISLPDSLHLIHQPKNNQDINVSRKRLAFDELFYLQLASLIRKKQWSQDKVSKQIDIANNLQKIHQFIKNLPFTLTTAQRKTVREILSDMSRKKPMNRLLQGDVGSGKTVVAAIACYATFLNGFKTLFMAPTEILAFQHYQTLKKFLSDYGIKISLITGSTKIKNHDFDIAVGTHALLFIKKTYSKIALVIIDEQHRFGVEQRAKLRQQRQYPHLLTMTATPIPRTIALTFYGELDMSIIDEMPYGRKKIKTYLVPLEKYQKAFSWVRNKILKSKSTNYPEQAYIIYPLIEESEILYETKAATKEYERLKKEVFSGLKIGLLHGKMKPKEKNQVITNFADRSLDILVSTSVVEVGMDIKNATMMIIENAERFGLAQLHQLRGRIGRNDKESYCLLFSATISQRLKALSQYYSGLKLAEMDLKLRGSGEIYGIKQHGSFNLKIADLTDIEMVELTRQSADKLVNSDSARKNYPLLYNKVEKIINLNIQPD